MVGQIVVIAGASVALIVVIGQLARLRLRRRHRPTGRLVDVGGYRLHVNEAGSGPTVVLEAGIGAPGLAWEPTVRALSRFARVVTYDRAGLGWSDRSPLPRTADVMADELHALLERAAIPGPYVLVGHSFGGMIARVFVHRYPEEVAGLVLLDGAHEDQFRRFPEPLREYSDRMSKQMPVILRVVGLVVRAGLLALRPSLVPAALGPLPADALAAIRAITASDPKVIAAMSDEMSNLERGNDRVRELAIGSLGDVPLVVVSHGRAEGVPPQFGPEITAEYERTWQDLQRDQAALSTRSRLVVAEGIGHDIPTAAPAVVADAVREVLAAASIPAALAS